MDDVYIRDPLQSVTGPSPAGSKAAEADGRESYDNSWSILLADDLLIEWWKMIAAVVCSD